MYRLETLSSLISRVGEVGIVLNDTSICNGNKDPAYVTFLTEFGDLPMMVPTAVSLEIPPAETPMAPMHIIRVTEEQKGTFKYHVCLALLVLILCLQVRSSNSNVAGKESVIDQQDSANVLLGSRPVVV